MKSAYYTIEMNFLHTCWCENALYVWAEQDVEEHILLQNTSDLNWRKPLKKLLNKLKEIIESIIVFIVAGPKVRK